MSEEDVFYSKCWIDGLVSEWRREAREFTDQATEWANRPNTQVEVFGLMSKAALLQRVADQLEDNFVIRPGGGSGGA